LEGVELCEGASLRVANPQLQLLQILAHGETLEHVVASIDILHHLVDFCKGTAIEWNASEQGGFDEAEIVLGMDLVTRRHEVSRFKRHQVNIDGIQRV